MAVAGTLTYKTELDTSGIKKSGSTVKSIIAGLGITKMISSAMSTIKNSTYDAIKRFDTLNNFPKVMSNLGISADESSKSIKKMSDKLSGLPTTLDQGALAVQRFTSKNGDVAKSTDIFLALNNALLAGGAGAEIQATALEQISQAYAKGKPDMMEWRSLQTAMPAQLKQVSKSMLGNKDALEQYLKKAKEYAKANPMSSTAGELVEQLENVKKGTGDMTTALGTALRTGIISMDDFTGAIMRLNEKGLDGFQNFEQQARNATGGIGTAIIVAKTQVVKGLTDIIQGIDKGLKKSGTSISQIIASIGKKAKVLLDGIGKALSKIDFNKLIKTLKAMIPVLGSIVAGMIAYKSAVKLTNLTSAISQAKNFSGVLKALIPSLTGAKTSMLALNSAFAISPIGLTVAGVTGLIAGFTLLASVTNNEDTELQKIDNTLKEYNNSMKEANEEKQEYLDKNMNEIQNTENLANELKALVDENGRVKEGYEDRVKFILGELNKALGTEYTMTGNVVDNYEKMTDAIENVVQAKRAKVLLEAQEKVYNKAMDDRAKIEQSYANAQKESTRATKERSKYLDALITQYKLTDDQVKQLTENYRVFDENGKTILDLHDREVTKLIELTGSMDQANIRVKETADAYNQNRKTIGDYEYALTQLKDHNYSTVLQMYEDTTNYNGSTTNDTIENLNARKKNEYEHLEWLKQNKKNYNKEAYDIEVQATNDRIAQIEKEQQQAVAKVSTGQAKVKNEWNKGLSSTLSELTGHNIQFERLADGQIKVYIDGYAEKTPKSRTAVRKWAEAMEKEVKKLESGFKTSSTDSIRGFNNAFQNKKGSTFRIVESYGKDILQTLKDSLKEKSPSRATREMGVFLDEGLGLGVKDGEKETLKTVNKFGNNVIDELSESMDFNKELESMYKEMNNTIRMENSKLNFDVVSGNIYNKSFFQTPVEIDLNASVEMDNQKVGRIVTPSVVKTIKTGGGQL